MEENSFAVFSLAHAACGDDVLEVRVGERMLLEWCMACAVMEVRVVREVTPEASPLGLQHVSTLWPTASACQHLVFAEGLSCIGGCAVRTRLIPCESL